VDFLHVAARRLSCLTLLGHWQNGKSGRLRRGGPLLRAPGIGQAVADEQETDVPMMNLVEHAVVAVAIQIVIALATRNWWIGAALASGYFLGREVAQAEYRWIEQFGDGLRTNLPWWGALDVRLWTERAQVADWLGPILATTLVAVVITRRRKSENGAG
jgi:hypothetical protein